MSSKSKYSEQFDKKLIAYQKCAFLLALPPLLSIFSLIVAAMNPSLKSPLLLGYAFLWTLKDPSYHSLVQILVALGALIVIGALVIFGYRGKLWCYEIALGLYALDIIPICFGFAIDPLPTSFCLFIHILFLGTGVLTNIYYQQAKKLLPKGPGHPQRG